MNDLVSNNLNKLVEEKNGVIHMLHKQIRV